MVTVTEVLFGQKDKLEGKEEGVEEEEQEGEQDPVQQDDVKTPLSQTLTGLTSIVQCRSLTLENHIQVQQEDFRM